ncbi:MAG: hypothetical protein EBT07_07370 [Actinobacteria bacterium]|nr:hypothetical protein [Actinomycetota bacterium]
MTVPQEVQEVRSIQETICPEHPTSSVGRVRWLVPYTSLSVVGLCQFFRVGDVHSPRSILQVPVLGSDCHHNITLINPWAEEAKTSIDFYNNRATSDREEVLVTMSIGFYRKIIR